MRRLLAPALGLVAVAGCGGREEAGRATAPDRPSLTQEAPAELAPPLEPVRRKAAIVTRRTQLRTAPDGRVVQVLSRKTRFGSRQRSAIVARKGDWLGVLHPSIRRGRAGWIPAASVEEVDAPYEIAIDRSAHVGRVRRDGKVIRRFKVAVGRAESPTPLGRYAVTDLIKPVANSPYGCCILALTARQGRVPQGWGGGNRVALHGSPTDRVGGGVSAGCVRLKTRDLRWLFRRTDAGTRVEIVA